MNIISFPNLGIKDLKIKEVAFSVFGVDVAWYGVLVTLAIISAVMYVYFRAKSKGVVTDDFLDLAIFIVICGVIGTRLFYVLTSLDQYDSFWDVFKIWEGGLAIYGGIIGGAAAAFGVLLYKKMNIPKFFDWLAPAVMLGQTIGRWGNFVNGEAFGSVERFEFLGKTFDISGMMNNNPLIMTIGDGTGVVTCQPTFLYESLWNLVGFVLINVFFKKKKYDGQVTLWYLSWYGFGRMFIEGLRTDSLITGGIRVSQLIGLLCFVICVTLLVVLKVKNYSNDKPLYLKNDGLSEETVASDDEKCTELENEDSNIKEDE